MSPEGSGMNTYRCVRCGTEWSKEGPDPIRCPMCRSNRWRDPSVTISCDSCGFVWNSRGHSRRCPRCGTVCSGKASVTVRCRFCGSITDHPEGSIPSACPGCGRPGWIDSSESHRRSNVMEIDDSQESEMLRMASEGMSAVQIARELGASFESVMFVLKNKKK